MDPKEKERRDEERRAILANLQIPARKIATEEEKAALLAPKEAKAVIRIDLPRHPPEKLKALSDEEKAAYEFYISEPKALSVTREAPLSKEISKKMRNLFFTGRGLDEIHNHNSHYTLGQIVHAAVEYNWFTEKKKYLNTLLEKSRTRAVHAAAEATGYAADVVSAIKKRDGDKVARFLQSNDTKDLEDALDPKAIRLVKDAIELMEKLTGGSEGTNLLKPLEEMAGDAADTETEGAVLEHASSQLVEMMVELKRKNLLKGKKE